MPITLSPVSRRGFLKGSLLAGVGFWTGQAWGENAPSVNPHRFALLADTHIDADPKKVIRGTSMFENLKRINQQLLAQESLPSGVLIDGDCAFNIGTTEDYQVFLSLLEPLREGGIPVHLALGNHDHRLRFREAVSSQQQQTKILEEKHVSLVQAERVNWIVLDSLYETNKTPGLLGDSQLMWLAQSLDQHPDKPAILMMHHNPDESEKTSGLTDTRDLFEILKRRKQVKAVIFGHTHYWNIKEQEGIHLINLPPVGYVFNQEHPYGWVDAHLETDRISLKLNCLDTRHSQHGETHNLTWRT